LAFFQEKKFCLSGLADQFLLKSCQFMESKKRKVIAIVGPTASGKTGIGVKLAKEFNGEIISADSRQVYCGLDIGTGKDLEEYSGIKYHMIDIANPEEKMTLFDYFPKARKAIEEIFSRGKIPIIVGGTGLYIQGLVEGFELEPKKTVISTPLELRVEKPFVKDFSANARDDSVQYSREQLDSLTIQQLNNILRKIDPEKSDKVDKKNRHRLIRAIELAQEGVKPTKKRPDFEVLQIGIDIPRKELHERIDRRVDERFKRGMLEETRTLLGQGISADWLLNLGLEYRVITEFLLRMASLFYCSIADLPPKNNKVMKQWSNEFENMRQVLKFRIHQFARRQMTWFRRFPEINWLSDYKDIKRFAKIFLEH